MDTQFERYKKARRAAGAAMATVNRELAVISHLLNKAVEWKWIKAKTVKIVRFKEENSRIIYLTDNQCAACLKLRHKTTMRTSTHL